MSVMRTASLQNHEKARKATSKKSSSFIKLTFCLLAGFILYQTIISVIEIIG